MSLAHRSTALLLLFTATLAAQQPTTAPPPTTAATAAERDTSFIDADGTAHITRVVPIPDDLSPEAKKSLIRILPDQGAGETLAANRARMDARMAHVKDLWTAICPNTIVNSTVAGVPVFTVTPANMPPSSRDKVLINIHGGGFVSDSSSYSDAIPIASYTGIRVVSVLYRLAPEHPFPAALDDVIAVYKELLKTYKPDHIVLYGTSAGAVLTAEAAVKLKQLGLPLPAALGVFSAIDSFARPADSQAFFNLSALSGHLDPPSPHATVSAYVGSADPKDPVLSPIYADVHGFPPTLFMSSERDALLSGTANLQRAWLRAGVDANLVVFDALPHAFWWDPTLPESIEATHIMANFILQHLPK